MQEPLIASFDVGTTVAKGILIARGGGIVAEGTATYDTTYGPDGTIEQRPDDWWRAICDVAGQFWRAGWQPSAVKAIGLSGQMQDVIVVTQDRHAIGPAILYADARAARQSDAIRVLLEEQGVPATETAAIDGASPLAKMVWLREHERERMDEAHVVLFNAKDYILARLTGVCATDATTAGTTACLDLPARQWHVKWLQMLGLPTAWLPALLEPGEQAGTVHAAAAAATGFVGGTPVMTGMGDAAAATLSAGLTEPGDVYVYLGTTAWAATVVRRVGLSGRGVFHLPYVTSKTLIAAAPLLNAGSAHHWIMSLLGLGQRADDGQTVFDYDGFERLLGETPDRSGGTVFLPYLNGERCPVRAEPAMGTFVHLGARTGKGQMAWAVMEGICFALREVLEALGTGASTAVRMVGGMARSAMLRQLLADVCNIQVNVAAMPEAGGALAAALPAAVTLGWFERLEDGVQAWLGGPGNVTRISVPHPERVRYYAGLFATYQRVYPLVSQLHIA